jgi:predicted glycosyltransferase
MELKRRLSFLSYAVNGAGVGHVVRQVAIQAWIRDLCAAFGVHSEHWFLTTSEADSIVFRSGFAAFKLPSKSIVEGAGIDKLAYIALAKQWVWHSVGLLRPDVLIVDTFAEGSFHELPAILDVVKKRALVQRPMKAPFLAHPRQTALLQSYDAVIVPEHEDDEPELREQLGITDGRVHFTGPIIRPRRGDCLSRADARAALGIADEAFAVLVTAGGGGDDGVSGVMDVVDEAFAADDDVHVVFGAGPLYRGRQRHGPRRTFFAGHDLAEHAAAFDVAVTAAGFNTIHELLYVGVPLVAVPQVKIADDQAARAERYVQRGAVRMATMQSVVDTVRALRKDPATLAAMSAAGRAVMPENHARDAALSVLSLYWPPSIIEAARRLVTDDVVAHVKGSGDNLADVFALAHTLVGHDDQAGLTREALEEAMTMMTSTALSAATLTALADQLKKKFLVKDVGTAIENVAVIVAGGHHVASVTELLRVFAPERSVDVDVVTRAIADAANVAVLSGLGLGAVALRFKTTRPPPVELVREHGSVNAARLVLALQAAP